MSRFSDYISSLEGKENLDPLVIASTLLELHNEEMSTADSKIASLNEAITEKDTSIANRDAEIQAQKAKNWDLAQRVPVDTDSQNGDNANSDIEISEATFDDFFVKE